MPQSLSNILIHIIFSTKGRHPYIQPAISHDLYCYIVQIARAYDSYIHKIGGIEDHVHLLAALPRTLTTCKLIEEIKKGSSKWIKTQNSCYRDFAWQNGYGAFSIGYSNIEALKKYIENQSEHHKKISFQNEYRTILKKYCVTYDEQYVWD